MKKIYQTPNVEIILIKSSAIMISASAEGLQNGGGTSGSGITTAGSRGRGEYWDDED